MTQGKVRVWCEWDIGHENVIYASEDVARANLPQILPSHGIDEPLDELEAEGLIGFEPVEVIGEVRYQLVSDDSGHAYVVPADKATEWYGLMDSAAPERDDNPPEWAKCIGGILTFTDPEV
jgi:hypothetical protein